jgi:hypothetical protein
LAIHFERKVLRQVFCLNKQAYGFWGVKIDEELSKLVKGKNIVRGIK